MDSNHLFSEEEAVWLFGDDKMTLQETAAFKLVYKMWSDIMLSGKYHNIKTDLLTAMSNTWPVLMKFIKNLKVGKNALKLLYSSACTIENGLSLWCIYYYQHVLFENPITLFTCHVKYAVFKSSGEFDYKESSRKMIAANQFPKRYAFEIMCRFCMEDELRKLPKSEVKSYSNKINFNKGPLSWYWILYLTNRKELKNFGSMMRFMHNECCPEAFMITTKDVENWPNLEWFWDHMCSDQDRLRKSVEVLANINKDYFMKEFYWRMNDTQWRHIFTEIPVDVLFVLFRQYKRNDQGFFVWNRMKDTFTGEQFADLLDRILKEKEDADERYKIEWHVPTAMKLWNSASDDLKNYIFKNKNSIIIEHFFEWKFLAKPDQYFQFVYDLLSFATPKYRRELILAHGDVIFVLDDISKIDKIVKLCLPNAGKLDQFKKFVAKSPKVKIRSKNLFVKGKFAFLDNLFDSYYPNKSTALAAKKELLQTIETLEAFVFKPSVWREFEKFVDTCEPNAASRISFKKKFISSFTLACFENWKDVEQVDHLRKIADRYLPIEEEVKLRKSLRSELQNTIVKLLSTYVSTEGKYCEAEFIAKMYSWLGQNAEKTFRSNFPIDIVFGFHITNILKMICYDDFYESEDARNVLITDYSIDKNVLTALDEFLKWYFAGADRAKEFKLRKIFAFDDKEFYSLLKRTAGVDEQDVGTVVNWFLGYDADQIRKFKAECSYETISKTI